ncbi:hypothetical protein ACTG1M_18370 [Aeromonas sp. 107A]|uniref:hypothetical protein n=1 Tax=Aeromonas veronii TaxID=654 RepID=UPI0022461051|nr:hypothetical protein [Aeromonas veronii]MCX0439904.1 hypothetical protein [Aeromonas veronii]
MAVNDLELSHQQQYHPIQSIWWTIVVTMTKNILPDTDYLKISKAADILNCEIDDIIHWAANGKTTLYLMLEEAECAVIIRNLTPQPPITALDNFMAYQDRLTSAIPKITQGEFGLSQLSFNDVRPKAGFGDVPMFHRFTYGGKTFPLTLMAKAYGLWAVGHRFAKHMERHGEVLFRPFFLKHGYLLNLDKSIDGFQVSIVPVTSSENPDVPDYCVQPEHLWLTSESMQQLIGSSAAKPKNHQSKSLSNDKRYSRKKHAMLAFLTELLAKQDNLFAGITQARYNHDAASYELLTTKLSHALQLPIAQQEGLIQLLLRRCAQSSTAFFFLGSKPIEEWSGTAIAEEIQDLMKSRDKGEIQRQLANIDKNTINKWLN